jgi:mRNA interferase HigB
MVVFGKRIVEDFVLKHAQSRSSFTKWLAEIEAASPANHNELKRLFPSADYVGNKRYIFNVGGNNYRVASVVEFIEGVLFVRWCGTHADYSKIKDCSTL